MFRFFRLPSAPQRTKPRPIAGRIAPAMLLVGASAAGMLGSAGCTATNFLDPEGPRYYETSPSAKPEEPAARAGGELRIVTFNLRYGREIDAALRLIRTNDALRAPDILLLQEMSGAGVVRLAAELSLNYLYYPSGIHPQAHQEFGTAILSPWPLEDPQKLMLPHGSAITGLRRAATAATARWRNLPIRVYSVHLPSPLAVSAEDRRDQIETILDAVRHQPGPSIVAGDFNSQSVASWFEAAGFAWLTRGLPGTSRGLGVWLSFDHVFTKGLRAAGVAPTAGYVETGGISDHRAVWARLCPIVDAFGPLMPSRP